MQSNRLLEDSIDTALGNLACEIQRGTASAVENGLDRNITALNHLIDSVKKAEERLCYSLKQSCQELEDKKRSFFMMEDWKNMLFWAGCVCNIGTLCVIVYQVLT
jgi:hypothetical protein